MNARAALSVVERHLKTFRQRIPSGFFSPRHRPNVCTGRIEPLEPRIVLAVNLVSGDIPNGTVWAAGDIQLITGDTHLPAGATLTIQPGAIIQFREFIGLDLLIEGTIVQGAGTNKILFTSARDDTGFDGVLGTADDVDTNANGSSTGAQGDWNTIRFTPGSTANLNNAEIRFGGDTGFGSVTSLLVESSNVTFTNSAVRSSESGGVRILASNPTFTNSTLTGSLGPAISMDLVSNPAISGFTATGNAVNGLALDGGTLSGSRFWNDPDIVYRLTGDVTVAVGATLTIAPDQIVKARSFFGDDLIVDGTLIADGTAALPIIFTSDRDDSAGGDTNNDGASAGANGDWNSIIFDPGSSGNIMDNVQVRFAGDTGFGKVAAVVVDTASLTLTNSTIRQSESAGIRILSSNPTLTANSFINNLGPAVSMDLASNPAIAGVTLTSNGVNGLAVDGGTITGARLWNDPDIVYRLTGDITVAPSATLTIAPGQIVKARSFFGDDIFVSGTLIASGTATQPIIFTADRDDTAGGDTNNDGASTGFNGDWNSIVFNPGSTGNVLDNVQIRFAGDTGFGKVAALVVDTASLTLTNTVVRNSESAGIRIIGSDPVLMANTFTGNFGPAISMDLASNPAISGVTLTNNGVNGLALDGGILTGSRLWNDSDIVYRLTGDVTVAAGATLTIAPGQVVKARAFFGDDLIVNGTLVANATAAQPIIFTCDRDDSARGDTNNDGASNGFNGDWNTITFTPTSTGNVMDNVEVRFGGDTGFNNVAAILVDHAPLLLTNSVVRHSESAAIRIVGSNPTLTGNTLTNNFGAAVSMDLTSNPAINGISLASNGVNGLTIDAGTLSGSRAWDDPDIVYRLSGDVTVPAGATLTIAPGMVVKARSFFGDDIFVSGTLIADGTAALPITFTSDRDDSAGGDTNNDGASAGFNGDWNSIVFNPGSSGNVMDNVQVRFAGDTGFGKVAAVVVDTAALTLTNTTILRSESAGIRVIASNPTLTGNTFTNNFGAAVSMDLASNPAISGVTLASNGVNGLTLDGGMLSGSRLWNDPEIVYRLTGDITVAAGATLTISPGQIVKMRTFVGEDIFVSGTLLAAGTVVQPVIFTSDRDDSVGGDTNNDGPSSAFNGDWNTITFLAGSTGNVINHAEVRFGGDTGFGVIGTVVVDGGSLTLTNSVIRHSESHAVAGRNGGTIQLSNNLIRNNFDTGIRAESGAQVTAFNNTIDGNFRGAAADGTGTVLTLTNNLITNNSRSGVFRGAAGVINTSFNDVFNPTASSGNYEGLADQTGTNSNLSADAKYFNRASGQFQLRAGSPALDAATSTGAPATDFFGNPRFDDPNIPNINGAGTQPFFDRGAFERQEISTSDIDLHALSVTGPSTGLQGQAVTVSWMVENLGPAAVLGSWFDAVYLSADDVFTPDDVLLGEAQHTGDLAVGASYSNSKQVTLPGVLPGDYRLIVRANSHNDIFEALALVNNSAASVLPITMDLPVLNFGTPVTGQLAQTGRSLFYKVNAPAGADFGVSLDGPNGATNELYLKFADLPTRQDFDERGIRANLPDQTVSVSGTEAGTYYVEVFGANLSSAENFTLSATLAGFGITSIFPARGSNTGEVTVLINGSQFDANSQPRLVDSAGATISPTDVFFSDSGLISATFDLVGRALGAADVQVVKTGNVVTTLPDALQIVAGSQGHLVTSIVSPGRVRLGTDFVAYLEYHNTGDTDLVAPIVRVVTNGNTKLSLTSDRADAATSLELITINPNGPAGVLPPGAAGRIPIYGRAVSNGDEVLRVEVAQFPNTPIDYTALESSIRPPGLSDAEWVPLFNKLKQQLGTSWSGYIDQISHDATLLPAALGENTSVQDVFQLEVDEARAALNTSLTGKLFIDSTTRILPNATVVFEGRNTGAVFAAVSLNDGSFLVPRLTADTFDVHVDGFALSAPTSVTVGTADFSGFNLVATPAAAISGGVLLSTTGQPLPNVLVSATSATGELFVTRTTGTGTYQITGLPAGTYDIQAGEGQFVERVIEDVVVAAGAQVQYVNLPLSIGGTIGGHVAGPGGAAVSGALVVAYDANGHPVGDAVMTSSTGDYLLSGLPGEAVTVLVTANALAPAREANINVTPGTTIGGHNFTLVTGGSLTGSILSQAGAPVANAVVLAESDGVVVSSLQANADGTYRFDNLPAGSYVITSTLPGFFTKTTNASVTNGQTTALGPLTLGTAGSVTGTLTRASGAPLGGVHVTAWLNDERVSEAVTESDGDFVITGLDLGTYLITAGSPGSSAGNSGTVALTSGAPGATLNLTLPVVGSIAGTVFDSNGTTPLAGVPVTLLLGNDSIAAATSDAQGHYLFDILAAGTYTIHAFTDGKAFTPDTNLNIANNTDLTAVNVVAGSAVVQGTLTNAANSQPLANARLFVTGDVIDGISEIATDAQGHYVFTGPAGAHLQLVARPDGLAFAVQDVTLSAGAAVTANFALGAGATLAGTVRDADNGAPLARALIQFRNVAGPADGPIAITDSAGHYQIAGLPAGNYDIVVVAKGNQSLVITNVALAAGVGVRDFSIENASTVISGLVRDPGNKPLAGARIQASDARGNVVSWTEAGDDGAYSLIGLPAGTFTLAADTAGAKNVALAPITIANGGAVQGANFSLTPVAISVGEPSAPGFAASLFGSDPPKRLPDEVVLPSLPPGENCVRVIEAFREAEARIHNRDQLFEAWSENVAAGTDLKEANAKLLGAQALVFAGNLAKIGLKLSGLRTEVTQAGRLGGLGSVSDSQKFLENFNEGVGLGDTYIIKGRDLINAIGDALITHKPLGGLADIVGQLGGILGAVRDLTTRLLGDAAKLGAFGKVNPLFDIFLDVVSFIKDTVDGGMDLVHAVQDVNTINGNTDLAKDLYIKASVKAFFAVDRYNFELNHCEENDPKAKSPADVPLPGFLGGPGAGGSSTNVTVRSSFDPNDKHGPLGFGTAGFIQPSTMPFEVEFENVGQIAAQVVTVTDTLDTDLDLTTFQFATFGFGNRTFPVQGGLTHYETMIDLRNEGINLIVPVVLDLNTTTRVVTAKFSTLDPLTLLAPEGFDGFLPPDNTNHDGEGFFNYIVQPKTGLATGTQITNQASIVFDVNTPILTPMTLNTIDVTAPSSAVNALPASTKMRTFDLSWAGTDGAGSGVATFDVFVSDNTGPFTRLVSNTAATSTSFTGLQGHTYGFYTVASDNAGLAEAPAATADTTISIEPAVKVPITKKTTFTDSDGDSYTVSFAGPGTLNAVVSDPDNLTGSLDALIADGTTLKSKITVTVKKGAAGDGIVAIGDVQITGALGSFTAKTADLSAGGFQASGPVKAITVRDVLHPDVSVTPDITVGGTNVDKLKLTVRDIADGFSLTTPGVLTSLTAGKIGSGNITAGSIDSIQTKAGDFDADLIATGTVGKITTKGGGVTGQLVAQRFGPISITGGNFSGELTSVADASTLGKTAALASLKITQGDLAGAIRLFGALGAVQIEAKSSQAGGNITNATINAGKIASLIVAKNVEDSVILAGADLGSDHAFGGTDDAADSFAAGSIGKVQIGGTVTAGLIGAGFSSTDAILKNSDDSIIGGAISAIASLLVKGAADPQSYFAAGRFKKTPTIGGGHPDPTTDPRFLVA